jgi:transcription elongation factor GreA
MAGLSGLVPSSAMTEPTFKRNPGDQPSATLTRDAYQRLRSELEELKTEGRQKVAERLERARAHGDIRENAEYDAAKDDQGLMEARIRELETLLKDPDVVDAPVSADEARPGVLVTVRLAGDEEETYLLAASKEERLDGVRTVTEDSPLGGALAGRKVGDRVSYDAPGGTFDCEIVKLEPRA